MAETLMTAPSTARSVPLVSSRKLIYPGVSMTWIRTPFQSRNPRAELMVIFLAISSGSCMKTEVPVSTLPIRSTAPAAKSMASARDVFPAAPCERMAIERTSLTLEFVIRNSFSRGLNCYKFLFSCGEPDTGYIIQYYSGHIQAAFLDKKGGLKRGFSPFQRSHGTDLVDLWYAFERTWVLFSDYIAASAAMCPARVVTNDLSPVMLLISEWSPDLEAVRGDKMTVAAV